MTLNPLAHIDVIGTVLVPIIGLLAGGILIGWAKPVVFSPNLLTRKLKVKTSTALIAIAGPLSNILLSIIFLVTATLYIAAMTSDINSRTVLYTAALIEGPEALTYIGMSTEKMLLLGLAGALVRINVILAAFNMIPAGPLDGASIVGGFLPDNLQHRYNAFRYSQIWFVGLMLLMYFGVLSHLLAIISTPIEAMLHFIAKLILGI
jgi:Zn-dependent protease